MRSVLAATLLMLVLAVSTSMSLAYALDIPPLTMSFDANLPAGSVDVMDSHVSWSSARLKGTIAWTPTLLTVVFQQGSTVRDFKVEGAMDFQLSGLHSFTGTIKVHLGTTPSFELIDFIIS